MKWITDRNEQPDSSRQVLVCRGTPDQHYYAVGRLCTQEPSDVPYFKLQGGELVRADSPTTLGWADIDPWAQAHLPLEEYPQ